MRQLRALALLMVVPFAACGLESGNSKHRCLEDSDCSAPNRCFANVCSVQGQSAGVVGVFGGSGDGAQSHEAAELGGHPSGGTGAPAGSRGKAPNPGSPSAEGGTGGRGSSGPAAGGAPGTREPTDAGGDGGDGRDDQAGHGGEMAGASGAGAEGMGAQGAESGCTTKVQWVDLESLQTRPRDVSPVQMTQGLGVIRRGVTQTNCPAVLIQSALVLMSDCAVSIGDRVAFDVQKRDGAALVGEEHQILRIWEAAPHFTLAGLDESIQWWARDTIVWAARSPYPEEIVTIVSYRGSSLAQAAHVILPRDAFDSTSNGPTLSKDAVFGADGKLLGFCAIGSCGEAIGCTSVKSIVEDSSLVRLYFAQSGSFWADVTGDQNADATTLDPWAVHVVATQGDAAAVPQTWVDGSYYGSISNRVADVTGDGLADFIVINEINIGVRPSTGADFSPPAIWSTETFAPDLDLMLADADGQPGAELLTQDGASLLTWRSSGSSFGTAELWGTAPAGSHVVGFADVTMDGLADAILARESDLLVLRSNGGSFQEPEIWLSGEVPMPPGWFYADVSGDGAADVIALDVAGARLFLSDGSRFVAAAPLTVEPPIGERENVFADVNHDGKADAIVLNQHGVIVYPSTGTDFGDAIPWSTSPVYGGG